MSIFTTSRKPVPDLPLRSREWMKVKLFLSTSFISIREVWKSD